MIEIENKETEKKEVERTPGPKGVLGTATAGLTIKQRYHAAHFKRVDAEDKSNPGKRVWVKNPNAPSLKQYARGLSIKGDPNAKDWFDHKNGSMNAKRTEANIASAKAAGAATKMEKRKAGAGKK
jgi:hypothetical protein